MWCKLKPFDCLRNVIIINIRYVHEVLTHFYIISYYINWGKTSWTDSSAQPESTFRIRRISVLYTILKIKNRHSSLKVMNCKTVPSKQWLVNNWSLYKNCLENTLNCISSTFNYHRPRRAQFKTTNLTLSFLKKCRLHLQRCTAQRLVWTVQLVSSLESPNV